MNEQIKQIADRIRGLREITGLSAESLAQELGIATAELRDFESGATDIPVSFLYQAAQRFGVELSSLLTGEEPRLHVYQLTRAGRGVTVERRRDYGYQSLAFNFVDKRMEPFLITVPPRPESEPVPLSSHPGQEFEHLLEGRLRVVVGGHELLLEAGDSVYFDSSKPHGMKAVGAKPARFLAVII